MWKKICLTFVIIIALGSAVAYAVNAITPKKPSDYKIGIPYQTALESDKPMLALFYVDWCGYCMRFMPKYKNVAKKYSDKFNVVMLNAEDPQYQYLVKDVALSGFPTLYIMDPKYDNRILLNNSIYQDDYKLQKELDRYLRIRSILDSVKK